MGSPPDAAAPPRPLPLRPPAPAFVPDFRALALATGATAALGLSIYVGSGGFRHFDSALTHYAAASMTALFALVYRITVWQSRPPTRRLFMRAMKNAAAARRAKKAAALAAPVVPVPPRNLPVLAFHFVRRLAGAFVMQDFIRRRGWLRWGAHVGISYGSMIAFAFTFPLVFGWVRFETPGSDQIYRLYVMGIPADQFHVGSFKALVAFNTLNIAAVMVLVGVALASWRRLTNLGERATQTFMEDWLPLLLLAAVSATGLGLTASARMLHGAGYPLIALTHAATVIALLLHIPFGKLLHIFQRSAHLAVAINKKAAEAVPPAKCRVCVQPFASAAQIEDLRLVLADLGMSFACPAPGGGTMELSEVCPACRRRLLAVNQGRAMGK